MPTEKNVTYKLYQFDELSDKAKEVARDWFRESDNELFDADDFKELVLTEPAAYYHRVKTGKCHFSLSYCQGDGVAFYGDFDLDFFMSVPSDDAAPGGGPLASDRAALQEKVRTLQNAGYSLSVCIGGENGHYHHWNSMTVSVEADKPEGGADLAVVVNALETGLGEYLRCVSRDIEKRAYDELDYRASAEHIDDCIRANEYTFSENGRRLEV